MSDDEDYDDYEAGVRDEELDLELDRDDVNDYEEEFGSNFKDAERGGGLGGVIGTQDSLLTQQEYNVKRIIDIATHEPFKLKITENMLNQLKDIPNVKIRNPFMIACIMKWYSEKTEDSEEYLDSFSRKYSPKDRDAFKIDFIRYKTLLKTRLR